MTVMTGKTIKVVPQLIDSSVLQAGSDTLGTDGTKTVVFPTAFPSGVTPKVFVSSLDANNSGLVLDITSVSNTGFTVKARKVTGITSGSAGSHSHTAFSFGSQTSGTSSYRAPLVSGSGSTLGYVDTDAYNSTCTTNTAGGHSHSVDAPAIGSIAFNWLAVNL